MCNIPNVRDLPQGRAGFPFMHCYIIRRDFEKEEDEEGREIKCSQRSFDPDDLTPEKSYFPRFDLNHGGFPESWNSEISGQTFSKFGHWEDPEENVEAVFSTKRPLPLVP